MAFRLSSRNSADDMIEWLQGIASTTYVKGSLYVMLAGLPSIATSQTAVPYAIAETLDPQPYNGQRAFNINGSVASPLRPAVEMKTTTAGERVGFIPLDSNLRFDTDVTPLINRAAAAVNVTVGQVITAYAGATSDFNGGIVYLPDQGWQGVVVTSVVAAGNVTLVFVPPAPRAATTGDVVSALPFGVGFSPQFPAGATLPTTLSNVVAEATGGPLIVRKVDFAPLSGATDGASAVVTVQFEDKVNDL